MLRNLCRFAVLIGLTAAAFFSAPPRAAACTQTCYRECATYYNFCFYHPGADYEGCNFVRHCGSSANLCNIQECIE
jgi:hypothetical protein